MTLYFGRLLVFGEASMTAVVETGPTFMYPISRNVSKVHLNLKTALSTPTQIEHFVCTSNLTSFITIR